MLPGLDVIVEAASRRASPHDCVAALRDATHPAAPRAPRAPACDLPDMPLILDAIAVAVSDTRLRPSAVRLFVELARRIRPGELWHGNLADIARDVGIIRVDADGITRGGSAARTAQAELTQGGHILRDPPPAPHPPRSAEQARERRRRQRAARRRGARPGWLLRVVEMALPPGRRQPRQIQIPPTLLVAIAAAPLGVRDHLERAAVGGAVDTDRVAPVDTDRVVQRSRGSPVDTDRVVQRSPAAQSTRTVSSSAAAGAQSTRTVSSSAARIHARDPDPDPDPEVGGVVVAGAGAKPATEDQITEVVRLCLRLGFSEAEAEECWREECTSLPAASATIERLREDLAEEQSLSAAERQRRRENQRRARL